MPSWAAQLAGRPCPVISNPLKALWSVVHDALTDDRAVLENIAGCELVRRLKMKLQALGEFAAI